MQIRATPLGLAFATIACATPAAAELPDPVRRMIEVAIETGDKDKVAAVVEAAKATNPDDLPEINAMQREFRVEQRELAQAKREEEREAIARAGFFDRWEGKGQIGAFQSTGNSENVGVSVALNLTRNGIDWSHKFRATMDYQRSNDVTSREQYFLAYEPRYQIDAGLFTYALAQYERDRFQGFSGRYAVSGGLGYKVLDDRNLSLSLKAGPAWRRTELVTGESDSTLAALAGLDFDWQLAERIKLTQDTDLVADGGGSATAIVDGDNTTINLVTGLEAGLIDSLTARLSYSVEYDSNPPANAVSTDTLTRFTLIYGF